MQKQTSNKRAKSVENKTESEPAVINTQFKTIFHAKDARNKLMKTILNLDLSLPINQKKLIDLNTILD